MMKTMSITIGMSLIAFGFIALAMTLDAVVAELLPVWNRLDVAEAEWYCELIEGKPPFNYDGGWIDCVDWHTSGTKLVLGRSLLLLSGVLITFKFLAGGFCLLYYADRPEKETV